MRVISLSSCPVIFLLTCQILTAQAADMYRWIDSRGIVHYSDMPSPDAEKIDPRKFSDAAEPIENLPYGTRIAQQNFPVVLYVGEGCGEICNQARSALDKRGIPFSETVLRTRDDIDTFRRTTGSKIIPTLAVGKTILKGFQAEQWHGELDFAGYPKTAPYRAPASQPTAPATPTAQDMPAP